VKRKRKNSLPELLHSDADTVRQITEELPADWDMEAVFRRSLRRYRQQSGKDPDAPFPSDSTEAKRPFLTVHMNTWVTAACLAVTVGIAGTIAWMQFSAPQLPETRNDISQAVTEIQPQATQTKPQTDTQPSDAVTEKQHSETEPKPLQSSAAQPAQTDSAPSEPDVTEVQAQENEPEQTPPAQTDKPQNAATTAPPAHTQKDSEPQQTTAKPKTTDNSNHETESPAVDEPDQAGQADAPEDGNSSGAAAAPAENQDKMIWDTAYGDGYMFQVWAKPDLAEKEYYIMFIRDDQTCYPDVETFSVDLDGYNASVEHPREYATRNSITNEETGFEATVQFVGGYNNTRYVWTSYSWEPLQLFLDGQDVPAYHLYRENDDELIWFDGMYCCTMHTKRGFSDEMIAVAEALQTH